MCRCASCSGESAVCSRFSGQKHAPTPCSQSASSVSTFSDVALLTGETPEERKSPRPMRPPVNLEELIGDLTLHRLNQIFQDVLKRQEEKIDPIRSKFGKIEKEEVSMSEKLVQVRSYLKEHKQFSFRQMLSKNSSKVSVIVTFLVILELIKTGFVTVQQENTMADIEITVVKDPDLIEDIEEE